MGERASVELAATTDKYGQGSRPLHLAADRQHDEATRQLIKAQADVNAARTDGHSPLTIAAMNAFDSIVSLLLEGGAFVNHALADGRTSLHLSAELGSSMDVVKQLLRAGESHRPH